MQRPRRGDDRGVSAVELAIIGPSLLLLIFFVIQVALYLYGRSVALQAARDAVSQLRLAPDRDQFDALAPRVHENAATFAQRVGSGALDDVVERDTYADDHVTVAVTGSTITLVPGFTIHVTAEASGRWERFEDAG
ncbi:MAG: TadE/TadG family type IV pilus assembly protein [Jatrophihabitans sp.]|uniref:TadE/TadG family type IV pilus assembly protein n=1 Tax=Jatrophihabitans sp. TaxID=1932789 RepID=UPI003F8204CC